MKYYMKYYPVFLSVLAMVVFSCEKKTETEGEVQKTVSALGDVLPRGAKLEKVTEGLRFDTAGSPLYLDRELYFTNNNFEEPEKSAVFKMDEMGSYHDVRENNGVTTTLRYSGMGTIYCCEMLGHRVIEMGKTGRILRVVCGEYNGKRIDGPNDLIVDSKRGIYFTDSQFIAGKEKMQETPAVYYVKPDKTVLRVIDDIVFPNGVALSPGEKILYVANTNGKYLLAYDVQPDGTVTNGRNFAELQLTAENTEKEFSGADGMAVDTAGNIFVATTQGFGIQVFNNQGTHLGNIPCDAATNNCTFGGLDMKTLYVSAKDGIYKIPMKIAGLRIPQIGK